jgi:hypothetical protein
LAQVNYKYAMFGLEPRHIDYLRQTFGHSRMSAGLRAILDDAMDDGAIGEDDEQDQR